MREVHALQQATLSQHSCQSGQSCNTERKLCRRLFPPEEWLYAVMLRPLDSLLWRSSQRWLILHLQESQAASSEVCRLSICFNQWNGSVYDCTEPFSFSQHFHNPFPFLLSAPRAASLPLLPEMAPFINFPYPLITWQSRLPSWAWFHLARIYFSAKVTSGVKTCQIRLCRGCLHEIFLSQVRAYFLRQICPYCPVTFSGQKNNSRQVATTSPKKGKY